ncbi:MAG: hypothetical protein CO094_04195 [Anaerolineae bacterium CG_4_9_14_3_um_filter_57_17]|nr:hypothetical protein [bacterium]NCT21409.1 hypothetical protein [bacterium]OIO83176.1 MAG: hypothetical protein AUK01_13430 [Anaerolineae bacterium CG2_30_57_67]PJB67398.1 MAG: hypothetical protein CO094_04195 [Anaerolineae bacterium CG_4_9_14_3_um_filter_57_17]
MPSVLIHIANEDPVLGEIEQLPAANDTIILVKNPRRRDGKDLIYLLANVTQVIWPMTRVSFIELLPGDDEEELVSFIRE